MDNDEEGKREDPVAFSPIEEKAGLRAATDSTISHSFEDQQ